MEAAKKILKQLKQHPELRAYYRQSVRNIKGLTLEDHTLLVMGQFEKYFCKRPLPPGMSHRLFRLVLALHDIGKPSALKAGDRRKQHQWTRDILNRLSREGFLTAQEIRPIGALIVGDPLGAYLKGLWTRGQCAQEIRRMAARSSLGLRSFFKALTIYYQADTSAYTLDAGVGSGLDALFLFDDKKKSIAWNPKLGILQFSPLIQKKYDALRQRF